MKDSLNNLVIRYLLDIHDLMKMVIDHPMDASLNEYRRIKSEVLSKVVTDIISIIDEEEDNCERSKSI